MRIIYFLHFQTVHEIDIVSPHDRSIHPAAHFTIYTRVSLMSSFHCFNRVVCVREGSITPRDGPPLPSSTSREGADMTAAGGRPSSRTTSAPTSPLKEKPRSSFLGKVTSLSQVRITV
jgi:hypothetical protein